MYFSKKTYVFQRNAVTRSNLRVNPYLLKYLSVVGLCIYFVLLCFFEIHNMFFVEIHSLLFVEIHSLLFENT